MSLTVTLARIMGPTLVANAILETRNWHIFEQNIPTVVYLNGIIFFASGVAIVQSHNIWNPPRAALVTGLGWVYVGLGLWRMAFPEKVLSGVQKGEGPMLGMIGASALAGITLSLIGYSQF